jgi:hypothetical protein
MTLDDLIPPSVTAAVAARGLHKIAGAMLGVPELDLASAARSLGERAYLRRKEARAIADGIAAFAAVTGEKTAENPALMAMLRRSVMPALAGAGIAAAPRLLSDDPTQQGSVVPAMGIGALLGAAGGALHNVAGLPPQVNQAVAGALR